MRVHCARVSRNMYLFREHKSLAQILVQAQICPEKKNWLFRKLKKTLRFQFPSTTQSNYHLHNDLIGNVLTPSQSTESFFPKKKKKKG